MGEKRIEAEAIEKGKLDAIWYQSHWLKLAVAGAGAVGTVLAMKGCL